MINDVGSRRLPARKRSPILNRFCLNVASTERLLAPLIASIERHRRGRRSSEWRLAKLSQCSGTGIHHANFSPGCITVRGSRLLKADTRNRLMQLREWFTLGLPGTMPPAMPIFDRSSSALPGMWTTTATFGCYDRQLSQAQYVVGGTTLPAGRSTISGSYDRRLSQAQIWERSTVGLCLSLIWPTTSFQFLG